MQSKVIHQMRDSALCFIRSETDRKSSENYPQVCPGDHRDQKWIQSTLPSAKNVSDITAICQPQCSQKPPALVSILP